MKKSRFRAALWLLLILFVVCIGLWVVFPPHHPHRHELRVKVEHAHQPEVKPTPETEERAPVFAAVPVIPEPETPVPAGHKPEIAIVIDDMGLNLSGSRRAIKLPGYITLSFMPYAQRLDEQTTEARDRGHELMLHMPMEPIGHEDPGPGALLTTLSANDIRARFDHALDSFDGFDGVNNHMGSRFTAYADGMEIVIREMQKRNLFFLDSRTSPKSVAESIALKNGLPTVGRDVFLDDSLTPDAIRTQLASTERVAKRRGRAVAIGHPHDATLSALEAWLPEAEKRGFVFVPVHDFIKPRVYEAKTPG